MNIPKRVCDEYRDSIREFNEHANSQIQVVGSDIPDTIYLPDLDNSFTRGVYSGMIKSFLPPQSYPHRNICTIEISSLHRDELPFAVEALSTVATLGGLFDTPPRAVVTIAIAKALVYIDPRELSAHALGCLTDELGRALSEISSTNTKEGSYGLFEVFASVLIFYHFIFTRGELIFLGTGHKSQLGGKH